MSGHGSNEGLLERLRAAELEAARPFIAPGAAVLEIGGGSGYQASQIAAWGCRVTAIDVASEGEVGRFFPVSVYDGVSLPFPVRSFDVVFSSNVLEHVKELPRLLEEMKRVLKPDGTMIHIVPSATWRIWTNFAHYVWIVRYLFGGRKAGGVTAPDLGNAVQAKGWPHLLKRAMLAGPHGENPNAIAEIAAFSRFRWRRVFRGAGLNEIRRDTNRLMYTGYATFPWLPLRARRAASRVFGSSCHVFVLRNGPPS